MKKEVMIVDGYNMIGAWPELGKLKERDEMEEARDQLLHQLSNYAKYEGVEVRVVFDAQFVPGIQKTYNKYQLTVVFTKEGETADSYIERVVGEENSLITHVTVATSDGALQSMVFQKEASRMSADELYRDIHRVKKAIELDSQKYRAQDYRRNSPWNHHQLNKLEKMRDELNRKKN